MKKRYPFEHLIKRPQGRWIPACDTNVAATFKRIRRELEQQNERESKPSTVRILRKKEKTA